MTVFNILHWLFYITLYYDNFTSITILYWLFLPHTMTLHYILLGLFYNILYWLYSSHTVVLLFSYNYFFISHTKTIVFITYYNMTPSHHILYTVTLLWQFFLPHTILLFSSYTILWIILTTYYTMTYFHRTMTFYITLYYDSFLPHAILSNFDHILYYYTFFHHKLCSIVFTTNSNNNIWKNAILLLFFITHYTINLFS